MHIKLIKTKHQTSMKINKESSSRFLMLKGKRLASFVVKCASERCDHFSFYSNGRKKNCVGWPDLTRMCQSLEILACFVG